MAFVGVRTGVRQLYVRRLDERQAVPIRVTETLFGCCFFSPTSDAVLVMPPDLTLRKVTLADSLVVTLADGVDYTAGVMWDADGRVVYVRNHALWEVPAAGGDSKPLVRLDRERGEVAQAWPAAISGRNAILFASMVGPRRDAHIEALSLTTGKRQVLLPGTFPRYLPSGHLVFFRDSALFAVPFDADRLSVTGTPVRVVEDVAVATFGGPRRPSPVRGHCCNSSGGTANNRLVWVTRQGVEYPVTNVERDYSLPRLAPDGLRTVVAAGGQLWVYDMQRDTFRESRPTTPSKRHFPYGHPTGRTSYLRHR